MAKWLKVVPLALCNVACFGRARRTVHTLLGPDSAVLVAPGACPKRLSESLGKMADGASLGAV